MTGPIEYIAPTDEEVRHMKAIRASASAMKGVITSRVPDSRERSLAITNLEQAVFWANAGIVRNRG